MQPTGTYDYIIVGAGSSGCVLANRLSADSTVRVLLLEAGIRDSSPLIALPKGIAKLMTGAKHAWRTPVTQERFAGVKPTEVWSRGRVLGGSSSINGMIYSRGHRLDYDDWGTLGGDEWNWDTMRAAYVAVEDHQLGATDYRGAGGPLHVSAGTFRYPLAEEMIRAGEQFGLPRRDELNHPDLEGVGYYSHTIDRGRRVSAARAFLRPVRRRPNLHVVTEALVRRVLFDAGRACGVEIEHHGSRATVACNAEVILSAGAIMSPAILQRSGIGDGAHLASLGIDVVVDQPLVGQNLQEHVAYAMPHRLVGARGLNRRYRGIGLVPEFIQYGLFRTGSMATGPFEIGAFGRSAAAIDRPDVQLYMSAYSRVSGKYTTEREPGFTIYAQMLRPTSRGRVAITSAEAQAPLTIEPNWLTTEQDRRGAVAMVQMMRSYVAQPALAKYLGAELAPGTDVQSDADILDAVHRGLTSGLHAVGTAAMGRESTSVLDSRLRVRGVSGLRVIDCAAMPGLVSGNTNGPAMAFGWRAADLILEDRRRPVESVRLT